MVIALGNNEYTLSKVDGSTNLLTLGRKYYLWQQTPSNIVLLTRVKRPSTPKPRKEKGNYWLFNVVEHTGYTPGVHLSLITESCRWRAYLLSNHFPLKLGETCELQPTDERIARPQRSLLKSTVSENSID